MRILYVNQTADVSGAERSLLALLQGLGDAVEPLVACPDGALAAAVEAIGVPRVRLDGTKVSFRLHPVHTARGLLGIGRSAGQLARLERRARPDLVHANTTRATLLALAPGRRAPLVSHIRDWVPDGRLPRLVHRVIGRGADQVVANSAYVARQFDGFALRRPVRVVHNPVDLAHFAPDPDGGARSRRELGIELSAPVLAVVSQITPWKAQDDAIRALAALTGAGAAAQLLVIGSAKFADAGAQYDNPAFERSLHQLAAELGVAERVRFLGEREDVPALLAASDLLLLPSWREAFGRIAVEAMAIGVPVVATAEGGPAEIVEPGVSGILVAPKQPQLWAPEIDALLGDDELRRRMGEAARARAADFGLAPHAAAMLEIYRSLSGGGGRREATSPGR